MAVRLTTTSFSEALPELLRERDMSLRALAAMVGVGDDHLSRVIRGARGKKATVGLVKRTTVALGLPEDYFPEVREAAVIDEIRLRPKLRDEIYFERIKRRKR